MIFFSSSHLCNDEKSSGLVTLRDFFLGKYRKSKKLERSFVLLAVWLHYLTFTFAVPNYTKYKEEKWK